MPIFLSSLFSRISFGRRPLAGLGDLLDAADPRAAGPVQLHWLERIFAWLFHESDPAKTAARFRYLQTLLDQNADRRERFVGAAVAVLERTSLVPFFSKTGYATDHGLLIDIAQRLVAKVTPTPYENDFRETLFGIARSEGDGDRVAEQLPGEAVSYFRTLLQARGAAVFRNLHHARREAQVLLAVTVAHHGLSEEVRRRAGDESIEASPFLRLARTLAAPVDGDARPAGAAVAEDVRGCRDAIRRVYDNMESGGVSVGLVHKLEMLSVSLDQIERLAPEARGELSDTVRALFGQAVTATVRSRSLRAHLRHQLYLLSKKIVERNGYSGEHYISRSGAQHRRLLLSAIGGGTIVVAMTVAKTLLGQWPAPPIFHGLATWGIYAGGFLTMQFAGATLATKLPSFTASHLARRLRETRSRKEGDPLLQEVRQMLGSQSIALAGNVLGVVVLVTLVGAALPGMMMSQPLAIDTLEHFHPVYSLAIFLGALTGVELWLSSLAGGWFENWVVFRRIPTAIAQNPRLRRLLSAARLEKIGGGCARHASGVATNIALAFLFAFVPLVGEFVGLNLNSKHVTIATASSLLAASTLHYRLSVGMWVATAAGLLGIGAMNLTVSFLLALSVATRAQGVKRRWAFYFIARAFRRERRIDD